MQRNIQLSATEVEEASCIGALGARMSVKELVLNVEARHKARVRTVVISRVKHHDVCAASSAIDAEKLDNRSRILSTTFVGPGRVAHKYYAWLVFDGGLLDEHISLSAFKPRQGHSIPV